MFGLKVIFSISLERLLSTENRKKIFFIKQLRKHHSFIQGGFHLGIINKKKEENTPLLSMKREGHLQLQKSVQFAQTYIIVALSHSEDFSLFTLKEKGFSRMFYIIFKK